MLNTREWSLLNELFHQACDLPVAQRDAFAREQAGEQPQLLEELLRMLQVEADATDAVRAPLRDLGSRIPEELPEPEPGTRFGPWQVDRLLGKGGMGQVYLGHRADGAYTRQVAIKLIGSKSHDARQQAHFERERQLLARMQHPAIAQIHDAGSDEHGRHYLVMEYVEGLPLTQWCNQHHLGLRARLRLLLRIAEGVQHAHQKGVVHRDLKPGNILISQVDGVPMPRIIDFGIAARTDADAASAGIPDAGGTPGYMSPEQTIAGMDVDSRSDVYSLGAILFELVSGKRPRGSGRTGESSGTSEPLRPSDQIDTLSAEEIAQLTQTLKLPPQRLRRVLRDDLDWIVARATQPDREQRYPSVASFADDLNRWLDGWPVQAAPQRRLWTLRKFVARHRLPVAAAALLLLSVFAGLIATTWALHRAEQAVLREQAINHFLNDVLTSVDPVVAFDLDQTLMRRVVDRASERIKTELAAHPEARARLEITLSNIYSNLGDAERALVHLESARDVANTHLGAASEPALLAQMELAHHHGSRGRLAEAEQLLRAHRPAAHRIRQQNPVLHPQMESQLGWVVRQQGGRAEEASQLLENSYRTLLERVGPEHIRTIDAGHFHSTALSESGRMEEAIALLTQLTATQSRVRGEDHPQTLALRNSLAGFHSLNDDPHSAEAEFRTMIDVVSRQHGSGNRMLPVLHVNLAYTLHRMGGSARMQEAGQLYDSAVQAQQALQGADHPLTSQMREMRAQWLLDDGQAEPARDELQAVLAATLHAFGENHPAITNILALLARSELALGNTGGAREHAQAALARLMEGTPEHDRIRREMQDILSTTVAP